MNDASDNVGCVPGKDQAPNPYAEPFPSLVLVRGRIALLYPTVHMRDDLEAPLHYHINQITYIAECTLHAARAMVAIKYSTAAHEQSVLEEAFKMLFARVTEGLSSWDALRESVKEAQAAKQAGGDPETVRRARQKLAYVVPSHEEMLALKVLHPDNKLDPTVVRILGASEYKYLLQPKPVRRHGRHDDRYASLHKGGRLRGFQAEEEDEEGAHDTNGDSCCSHDHRDAHGGGSRAKDQSQTLWEATQLLHGIAHQLANINVVPSGNPHTEMLQPDGEDPAQDNSAPPAKDDNVPPAQDDSFPPPQDDSVHPAKVKHRETLPVHGNIQEPQPAHVDTHKAQPTKKDTRRTSPTPSSSTMSARSNSAWEIAVKKKSVKKNSAKETPIKEQPVRENSVREKPVQEKPVRKNSYRENAAGERSLMKDSDTPNSRKRFFHKQSSHGGRAQERSSPEKESRESGRGTFGHWRHDKPSSFGGNGPQTAYSYTSNVPHATTSVYAPPETSVPRTPGKETRAARATQDLSAEEQSIQEQTMECAEDQHQDLEPEEETNETPEPESTANGVSWASEVGDEDMVRTPESTSPSFPSPEPNEPNESPTDLPALLTPPAPAAVGPSAPKQPPAPSSSNTAPAPRSPNSPPPTNNSPATSSRRPMSYAGAVNNDRTSRVPSPSKIPEPSRPPESQRDRWEVVNSRNLRKITRNGWRA